jgi:hypothetical protein
MQQKMIVSSVRRERDAAITVRTPLDAITRLDRQPICTVVLAGSYATNEEFVATLRELYPRLRVECEV